MAKKKRTYRVSFAGGNRASEVNPLRLVKRYKAVCVKEGIVVSPEWRDSKAEARADAAQHISKGHYVDYDVQIRS